MMQTSKLSKLLTILVVILNIVILRVASKPCRTPLRYQGECVSVGRCRNINKILSNPNPPSRKLQRYIDRASCTLPDVERSVCCQLAEVESTETNLLPLDCGKSLKQRIAYGNGTEVFEYPWMAILRYKEGNKTVDACGGTLISKRYILTSANCIKARSNFPLARIRLGEHNTNTDQDCNVYRNRTGHVVERQCADPTEDYEIESVVTHPDFNRPIFSNDIGLIRLNKDVVMKDHIHPICLPITPELRSQQLPQYIVTGWGTIEKQTVSDVLLQAIVPSVNNTKCQQIFKSFRLNLLLTDKQICAGGQDRVSFCRGDSGGPLGYASNYKMEQRFVQFGIVSAGVNTCGERNLPGIYCRVGKYMDWILDNMKP